MVYRFSKEIKLALFLGKFFGFFDITRKINKHANYQESF